MGLVCRPTPSGSTGSQVRQLVVIFTRRGGTESRKQTTKVKVRATGVVPSSGEGTVAVDGAATSAKMTPRPCTGGKSGAHFDYEPAGRNPQEAVISLGGDIDQRPKRMSVEEFVHPF